MRWRRRRSWRWGRWWWWWQELDHLTQLLQVVHGIVCLLFHQDDLLHQCELLQLHHLVAHLVPGVEGVQLLVQEAVEHLQVVPLLPQ